MPRKIGSKVAVGTTINLRLDLRQKAVDAVLKDKKYKSLTELTEAAIEKLLDPPEVPKNLQELASPMNIRNALFNQLNAYHNDYPFAKPQKTPIFYDDDANPRDFTRDEMCIVDAHMHSFDEFIGVFSELLSKKRA